MKSRLVLFCLLLFTRIGYSQPTESKIIGKWIITDVTNKAIVSICGPNAESKSETEAKLKQNYIGASIEFLKTKKLLYRDKKNRLEDEKNTIPFIGLYDYTWAITNEKKIEIIEISSNTVLKRILIKYLNGKIYLDFIGIVFELEKNNEH
ncbi:hypothetical protein H2O64_11210 [Kordia sp. YSTF-M3]|uniref:Lipocalin-like domain-containing protein n=1 Tax=Kordia aestuariivivens TaxID=2759037 RepID=A0ABR7Q9K3_9FLAO|nr:hypothetical protein [Kordia aestuariivivens]MBC8755245.1 hypothetical protein [Kordia aestuariivivens]